MAARHAVKPPTGPRLRTDSVYVAIGIVVASAASFLGNVAVVHMLSVPNAGAYILASSVTTVFALVMRAGLDKVVVKDISEARAARDVAGQAAAIRGIVLLSGSIGVVTLVVLLSGGWSFVFNALFHNRAVAVLALFGAMWACAEGMRTVFSETLRGSRLVLAATALGDAGRGVLFLACLGVVFLTHRSNLGHVFIAAAAASTIAMLLGLAAVLIRLRFQLRVPVLGAATSRRILVNGMPFYATTLWAYVASQADLFIAGLVLSKVDVAHYGVAQRLSLILGIPMLAVSLLLGPVIPELWKRDRVADLEKRIRTLTTLVAIPVICLTVALMIFSREVITTVYSPNYRAAAPILAILCAGPLVNVLNGPNFYTLMMTGHGRAVVRVTTIVGVLQIVAMYFAASTYGIIGLAVASSAGTIAVNLWATYLVRRRLPLCTLPFVRLSDFRSLRASLWALRSGSS